MLESGLSEILENAEYTSREMEAALIDYLRMHEIFSANGFVSPAFLTVTARCLVMDAHNGTFLTDETPYVFDPHIYQAGVAFARLLKFTAESETSNLRSDATIANLLDVNATLQAQLDALKEAQVSKEEVITIEELNVLKTVPPIAAILL